MFDYLRPLLNKDVCEAFRITDIEVFFEKARRACAHFRITSSMQKITKNKIKFMSENNGDLVPTCSFINTKSEENPEGGIYAMSVDLLGKGSCGKVKWGLRLDRPDDRLYTIKVQYLDPGKVREQLPRLINEISVGLSQRFFVHKELIRPLAGKIQQNKYYLVSAYAGITLTQWLKTANPSETTRIQVAIQLSLQVSAMHANKCAHRDLKLDNIYIDPNTLQVTIGDYGYSNPDLIRRKEVLGTPFNLPIPLSTTSMSAQLISYLRDLMFVMGPVNLDMYALKRTLSMPVFFNLSANNQIPSLLQGEVVTALDDLINTTASEPIDISKYHGTPLEIAARLILFLYQQPVPTPFSLDRQKTITDIYLDISLSNENEKKTRITQYLSGELYPAAQPSPATDSSSNDLSASVASPIGTSESPFRPQ
ncbi:MAG: protein kinase [Gammaproteobacteria bacterium]|nr:protein kinase [Gammaproteobacteria bacterium]